jgi:hypothetical protein
LSETKRLRERER